MVECRITFHRSTSYDYFIVARFVRARRKRYCGVKLNSIRSIRSDSLRRNAVSRDLSFFSTLTDS